MFIFLQLQAALSAQNSGRQPKSTAFLNNTEQTLKLWDLFEAANRLLRGTA